MILLSLHNITRFITHNSVSNITQIITLSIIVIYFVLVACDKHNNMYVFVLYNNY
nr:MAG TPA: hypothetical protein [Caudoviricetes sp.]